MDKLRISRVAGRGAVVLLSAVAALNGGAANAGTRPQAPSCEWRHGATLLRNEDNGLRICVRRGSQVSVALSTAPPYTPMWSAIGEHGRALQVLPQQALPVRGTTAGRFRAARRGTATLTSTRPVCPPAPDGPTCHSMLAWSVTVVVR